MENIDNYTDSSANGASVDAAARDSWAHASGTGTDLSTNYIHGLTDGRSDGNVRRVTCLYAFTSTKVGMSEHDEIQFAKGVLCLSLPLVAWVASRWRARGQRGRGLVLLGLIAALSVGLYLKGGPLARGPYLDQHDVYHYYMVGRYYPQLRTNLLYDCTIVADAALPRPLLRHIRTLRDLRTFESEPRAKAMARADQCHRAFGPKRWAAFKADLQDLELYFTRSTMEHAVRDRGTNASPTWLVTGGWLARQVPVAKLAWITDVDTVLIGAMLVAVGWAFDVEVMLVAVSLLTTFFWTRNPPIGGAILRFDWLAGSVGALCLWKKQRPGLAGAALAFAAGSKIFPALLGAGLVARGLGRAWRSRSLPRAELRFVGGFAALLGLLCGLAYATYGPRVFRDYSSKLSLYAAPEFYSPGRIGLPIAAAWRGEMPLEGEDDLAVLAEKRVLYKSQAPWVRALGWGGALGALVLAARRALTDRQVWLLGAAILPLVSQVNFYYGAFLLLPSILYASDLPRRGAALGLMVIGLASGPGNLLNARGLHIYGHCAAASVILCLWSAAVIVDMWRTAPKSRDGAAPDQAQLHPS